MSYKWISVRLMGVDTPGDKRIRCTDCPDWHQWEWNPSTASQCQRVAHDTEHHLRYGKHETVSGAQAVMGDAAHEISNFATYRRLSSERTAWAFGKSNFTARRLKADSEALESWAKEIRNWPCPELPAPTLTDCSLCSAKRMDLDLGGDPACMECSGAGRYLPEEPGEEQLQEWRHMIADDASEVLEKCPL